VRVVCHFNQRGHQLGWGQAFIQGMRAHGIRPAMGTGVPEECDLAVMWGARREQVIQRQRVSGRHYLILERGYFGDRFQMTSLAFDGLNGRGNFGNANSPADRWVKHGVPMRPWRRKDGPALLIGQVPGDMSIKGLDMDGWYKEQIGLLRARGFEVVFRPHPLGSNIPKGVEVSRLSLEEDFDRAAVVVTMNSNTGVDAVLAGVPTVTCDVGAMAWDVSFRDVDSMGDMPDRQQWAWNLGYCQWTQDEIASGEAWEHLKTCI
jgi:hypothetical protein